jgi:hypothetical protein
VAIVAGTPSSDGRLTSRCPSLLGVTAAIDNLTSDYQLLLDRYKFIKTFMDTGLSRHSQIHIYQDIIIKHIDKKLIKYIIYIIKHMFT